MDVGNSQFTIHNSQFGTGREGARSVQGSEARVQGSGESLRSQESGVRGQGSGDDDTGGDLGKTLFVKLHSSECPEYERLKLVHMMFPGRERMVIHFGDTKKTVGASCVIHDAFVREMREMLGEGNVVVK